MPASHSIQCLDCKTAFAGRIGTLRCKPCIKEDARKRSKAKAEYIRQRPELCFCGKPRDGKGRQCNQCRVRSQERESKRKVQRLKNKQCIPCGKPTPPTRQICDECAEKRARIHSSKRTERRALVLNAYGNMCECCGEANSVFLCIDHINQDGAAHRKALRNSSNQVFYKFLIDNDFPRDNFRILCYNCNYGRYVNGGTCPHEQELRLIA